MKKNREGNTMWSERRDIGGRGREAAERRAHQCRQKGNAIKREQPD